MSFQSSLDLKIHHPNNFQFNSVPESHDWSGVTDHPTVDSSDPNSVPTIDLNDPKLIDKIGKACEEWGIFLISNHGIEPEILNRFNAQNHRLFALPIEVKLKVAKSEGHDSGYGSVPSSHHFPKFMWSEGFAIATGSPLDHAQKLWPDDYASFCEVIEEYRKAINPLGIRLLHHMLLSLGLNEEEIKSTLIGNASNIKAPMHLNSYPACPNPGRVVGLAPHTDTGFIAIIHHNGVSGLQVLRRGDDIGPPRWVWHQSYQTHSWCISAISCMFCLIGSFTMLMHRSTVSKTDQRLSGAYFLGPRDDLQVEPLSKLTESTQNPLYRPVTWPEFLKLKSRLYGKALQSLKTEGIEF